MRTDKAGVEMDAQKLYSEALDLCAQKDMNELRAHIFMDFEEANSYYNVEPIEKFRDAIRLALQENDENLAVECLYQLYLVLKPEMTNVSAQKEFTQTFLEPWETMLTLQTALGNLCYYLGIIWNDLGLREASEKWYDAAIIKYDNEKAQKDDEVFAHNISRLFKWLEKYVADSERKERFDRYLTYFADLINQPQERENWTYKIAVMLDKKGEGTYSRQADKFYRQCITWGENEVVTNKHFLQPDYEAEFIKWFKNECKQRPGKTTENCKLCFELLWTNNDFKTMEDSHKVYAEELTKDYNEFMGDCIKEYDRCALEGKWSWATVFLLDKIQENFVQQNISDELIQSWFDNEIGNTKIEYALGMLFDHGKRREDLKNNIRYQSCVARYRFETGKKEGGMAPVWAFFRRLYQEFPNGSAISGFPSLVTPSPELKRKSNDECLIARLTEEIKDFVHETAEEYLRRELDEWLKTEDGKCVLPSLENYKRDIDEHKRLELYYSQGRFDAMEPGVFREPGAAPLLSRYLLLKIIANQAELACYGNKPASGTFAAQRNEFLAKADAELRDGIMAGDLLCLLGKICEGLAMAIPDQGSLWLLAKFVISAVGGRIVLPFYLLANVWNSDGASLPSDNLFFIWYLLDCPNESEWHRWISLDKSQLLHEAVNWLKQQF